MRAALVMALLLGCGGAQAHPTAAATTRYRVGDYVVYRYAGRLIGVEPMHLMEEVVSQDGDRLVIEVTLTRGHDTVRAWRQTIVDTEAHRAANHLEALCRIDGETCVPVDDPSGAGLRAMYDGLYVQPDAPSTEVTESEAPLDVGGTEMTCHLRTSAITRDGEPLTMKEYDCPDFLWGHGGALVEMADKRRVLLVTVESFGSGS
jgi:hypothetical protein